MTTSLLVGDDVKMEAKAPIFSTPAQRKRELEAMIKSGKISLTANNTNSGPPLLASSPSTALSSSPFSLSSPSSSSAAFVACNIEAQESVPKCCSGCFETSLCPSCAAEQARKKVKRSRPRPKTRPVANRTLTGRELQQATYADPYVFKNEKPRCSVLCLGCVAVFLSLFGLIAVASDKGPSFGILSLLLGVFLGIVFVVLLLYPGLSARSSSDFNPRRVGIIT